MILPDIKKNTLAVQQGRSSIVRILDVFFVLRPTLMFPLFTIVLAGHYLARSRVGLEWQRWLMLAIGLSAMFGVVYLLNQIRDRKSDSENGKLFLISSGALSKNFLLIESILLLAIVPVTFILAGFGNLVIWVIAMFLVAGILYNFTPFALQNHVLGGLLSGLLGGWLLIRFGTLVGGESGQWIFEAPYVIGFATVCLLTSLLDLKGDVAQGKKTFAVVYGSRKTILIGLIGYMTTSVWGFLNSDLIIAIPSAIAIPILFKGWWKDDISTAVIANKIGIFALSIAVGLIYPTYLVVIALYFPLARWYYLSRFGLKYPSFGSD